MNCKHQFINIEQVNRRPSNQNIYNIPRDEFGAKVGCPMCGEIRVIWANGEIEILVQGQNHHDEPNNETKEDRPT